ncbi:MAG: zinc dependent phospholipase C family protein [Bacillota bacterium]
MPDFWTHVLGGELMVKEMKEAQEHKYSEIIKSNQELFNLGCQGPDIFFYNDFWPWIKEKRGPEIGNKLHREKVTKLFELSLNFLKDNQNNENFPQLFAYLSGFIVHYALDRRMHPFIYEETDGFSEHKNLELNIDTYLTNKYWNKLPHRIDPEAAISVGDDLPDIIIEYYQYILDNLHEDYEHQKIINDSYRDFKKVFAMFYSRWRIKRTFFKIINPFISIDLSTLIYPTRPDFELLSCSDYNDVERLLLQGVGEAHNMVDKTIEFVEDAIEEPELNVTFPKVNFNGVHI